LAEVVGERELDYPEVVGETELPRSDWRNLVTQTMSKSKVVDEVQISQLENDLQMIKEVDRGCTTASDFFGEIGPTPPSDFLSRHTTVKVGKKQIAQVGEKAAKARVVGENQITK
jgi:hypothetical protein